MTAGMFSSVSSATPSKMRSSGRRIWETHSIFSKLSSQMQPVSGTGATFSISKHSVSNLAWKRNY
jgi:hypothetical protein